MMFYLSSFILVFNLLFLVILPHFLWIRWIIRAFRKRRVVGRVIAPLSYLLFLLPWVLAFQEKQRLSSWMSSELLTEDRAFYGLIFASILLSVGYFYLRWVYQAYAQQHRKAFLLRLSPLFLLPTLAWGMQTYLEVAQWRSISQDLGIQIPYLGTRVLADTNPNISYPDRIQVAFALDADVLKAIEDQIRQTAFYDSSKHILHGADELAWAKSDTLLYWKVGDHLQATHLTGLWAYDQEKGVYEFYEPSLSDIPNAALLFKESYTLFAEVNLKNRTLRYTRWQF